jgi:hypothetical protein
MTGSPFVDSAPEHSLLIAASREWHAMHACIGLVAPFAGTRGASLTHYRRVQWHPQASDYRPRAKRFASLWPFSDPSTALRAANF